MTLNHRCVAVGKAFEPKENDFLSAELFCHSRYPGSLTLLNKLVHFLEGILKFLFRDFGSFGQGF